MVDYRKRHGHRTAEVTHRPGLSLARPWNVALFSDDGSYHDSVGAVSHDEAMRIAGAWVSYDYNTPYNVWQSMGT